MNNITINEVNLYYNIGDISYYECIKQQIINDMSQYNNQFLKKIYTNSCISCIDYYVTDNITHTDMSIFIPIKIFLTIISDIYSELDLSYIINITPTEKKMRQKHIKKINKNIIL